MIVPQYWAEARRQVRRDGKQVTVRRFGWSDAGEYDAQTMADARADEALQQILTGAKLTRRERRAAYNGAHGVPIREEVVARHGDVVITRNSYGARCLNTPDIMFADVDFPLGGSIRLKFVVFGMLLSAAWYLAIATRSAGPGLLLFLLLFFAAAIFAGPIGNRIHRTWMRMVGGPEGLARNRLDAFVARNPAWNVRIYRTPAGLRLLATHSPTSPHDAVVIQFFNALGVDPIYARMCRNQNCFRARLTAKPWRIGISAHMRPLGVWPVRQERLPERAAWVAEYEQRAAGFAACRFVESVGSGSTHPKIARVVALHDTEGKATASDLPVA